LFGVLLYAAINLFTSWTMFLDLFQGSADPLNSAFHLTYNMVLNLLRVEEINPEYMLEKSFYQFQHYRAIPGVVESKYSCLLFSAMKHSTKATLTVILGIWASLSLCEPVEFLFSLSAVASALFAILLQFQEE